MKILYITDLWTGLSELLYKSVDTPRGMPAFLRPLEALVTCGNEVDLYLIHGSSNFQKELNIAVPWVKKLNIVGDVLWKPSYKKMLSAMELKKGIAQLLKERKYDFVYLQGGSAASVSSLIKKSGIPFGQRLYGTFMNEHIEKEGLLKAKLIHGAEVQAYTAPKDFLLITDDGSKGDIAKKKLIGDNEPYDFYFWKNGVEKSDNIAPKKPAAVKEDKPYLFYVARISQWKRQDKAVSILKKLKENGVDCRLYLAGQIIEQSYFDKVNEQIKKEKLTDDVVYLGAIEKSEIKYMCKNAISSFSLYDMCNLGNVFYEMLEAGAVIVSRDDGSLDDFIVNGENGYLTKTDDEAANVIIELLKNKELETKIRVNAEACAKEKVITWEKRVQNEIELIEKYAVQGND